MYEVIFLENYKGYPKGEALFLDDLYIPPLVAAHTLDVISYKIKTNPRSNQFKVELERIRQKMRALKMKLDAYEEADRLYGGDPIERHVNKRARPETKYMGPNDW